MPAHIHPSLRWFACETRPIFNGLADPGSASRAIQGPPRAQSPFARWRRYHHRRNVSCIASEGVTPPSSLIRAHAPDQNPPVVFGLPYWTGLCRSLPVPAGRWSFPTLFLRSLYRCLGPYPATTERCFRLFLPSSASASPSTRENRLVKTAPLNSFMWDMILGAATIRLPSGSHTCLTL